jgi:hypothetical protein
MVDLDAAYEFMATHARLLDRRRFDVVVRGAPADGALAALSAHRNPDGGFGWGLEPDLRDASSQPGPALHAFEVFEDIAPVSSPMAVELCDWLQSISLADGGIPFALPLGTAAGSAPFWANAQPTVSSLQITSVVLGVALRVARHDEAVAGHTWIERATDFCLAAMDALGDDPFAMEIAFSMHVLDAVYDDRPEAPALLAKLAEHVPADGIVPVRGGSEGEAMRPLDMAPFPDRPVRRLFAPEVVDADLDRLLEGQQDDGGWRVDFANYSPAAELEWRGHATVRAVSILKANGRI